MLKNKCSMLGTGPPCHGGTVGTASQSCANRTAQHLPRPWWLPCIHMTVLKPELETLCIPLLEITFCYIPLLTSGDFLPKDQYTNRWMWSRPASLAESVSRLSIAGIALHSQRRLSVPLGPRRRRAPICLSSQEAKTSSPKRGCPMLTKSIRCLGQKKSVARMNS